MMSTGDLLQVFPAELKFSYELKKTSSCLMQLGNKTDHYVAYKVKTTNPKKYCVRPNAGIVLPGSTCDVTVTMQAPKETTSDYNCKDRFLLQCVVAEHGATLRDITSDMFTKKPGKVVEEFKFKVVYIPSSPPSPVPEDPEEGLSPLSSTSENGSQNLLFDAALFSKNQDFKYAKARSSTCAQPGGDASEWMLINKLAKEKDSEIQLHQKLLQEVSVNLQVPLSGDIKLGDVIDCIQSLRSGSNCWRLLWILLGAATWHLWQERNKRWKTGSSRTEDVVVAEVRKDCKVCFEVKSKPPDLGLVESSAILMWLGS